MSDLPEHPLLHEIATAVGTPYDAIAGCMGSIQEVAPGLLAAIARAAETPVTSQSELNLVYYGVHILGAAREPRLQAPLLRLLRLSDEELEAVLGSDHVTTVPQIALGAFDGDAQALFDLLWDAEANEYARMTLFGTVAYLTWQGRIPAETTRAALYRFDAERPIPDGDLGWNGWETAIELLGWEELAPLVEAAYADGRLDTGVSDLQWFRNALAAAASAAPDDHRRFEDEGYGYIEDLLEAIAFPAPPLEGLVDVAADALDDELDDELDDAIEHEEPAKWMAGAQEPRRNPLRHVGRNDPCPCGSGKKYKKCCLVA